MSIIERAVAKFDKLGRGAARRPVSEQPASVPSEDVAARAAVPIETSTIERVTALVPAADAPVAVAPAPKIEVVPPTPESVDAPAEEAAPQQRSGTRQIIDLNRLREAGMVTPEGERTPTFEEFRLLKRPLLRNALNLGPAPVKNGNLIMVTSSLPGEGKSFCAANLALSIAMELDHTVLLVDADVAHPSVPSIFGLPAGLPGFMDVLLDGKLQLSDVLIKTNIEKLTFLPAGRTHPRATELLASTMMTDLLQEMARRYSDRILVFDSPPLLVTTEARVLATQMGQVVMVVEAGKTTQQVLKDALAHLESCEVVSLVLNKTTTAPSSGYYGYGYYGSYGK